MMTKLLVFVLPVFACLGGRAAVERVTVDELKPGTGSCTLVDGSAFAYEIVTDYPRAPKAVFRILKAPGRELDLMVRRQPCWKNADASMREHWVDVVRDGGCYRLRRAFAPGEEITLAFAFDEGARPGAAAPDPKDLVWRVAYDDAFADEDARRASLGELPKGASFPFALDAGGMIDLCRFKPDAGEKSHAVVWREIVCDSACERTLGVAVDWWFTAYVNGEKAYTTWPDGNCLFPWTPYDHTFVAKLRKGVNRLAFHVAPGSDGWTFLCRLFPDRALLPADARERARFLRTLFPTRCELKGAPWVTGVSADRARIGAELTEPGKLGVRYWSCGRPNVTNERWTVVAGQKDAARVHLFELDGLVPSADYAYALVQPGLAAPLAEGRFRTFPAKAVRHDLWLIGDTQFGGEYRLQVLNDLMDNCGIGKGAFLVSIGDVDNAFDDFSRSYHETYLDVLAAKGLSVPTVLVRGNHEYHGTESTAFPRHFGRPYCSFSHGEVFYFVLDTGEHAQSRDLAPYYDEQAAWLKAEVETPACRKALRRVVLAHAVPFAFDGASGADVARIAGDVFFGERPKCKIDLWLCGDIHCAYRWDPLSRTFAGRSRPAGWKKPTRADLQNVRFPVFVNDGPNAGWAKQSATHVEFSDTHATVTVLTPDGKTLDKVRMKWGRPFEVLESRYDYKYTAQTDPE